MSDERETISEGWIWTYDRRTGRVFSRLKLKPEEIREILARRAASGDPAALASEPIPAGYLMGQAAITTITYDNAAPPPYAFEHDPTARVYRLTAPDGSVEVFRDNPTRYLCLEPEAETGQMRPVMKRGRPVFLWLCREEHEVR
jgi:hypothetical protein